MVASLAISTNPKSILVLGLGGGSLTMFLHESYPASFIEAVELDEDVVQLATSYFGFKTGARLNLHIGDAKNFIENLSDVEENKRLKRDIIILDINSSDLSEGLSFPPLEFVSLEFLAKIRSCLQEDGMLVMNFGCRSQSLRRNILDRIISSFNKVFDLPVSEEALNHVIICCQQDIPINKKLAHISDNFSSRLLKSPSVSSSSSSSSSYSWHPEMDLIHLLKPLKIVSGISVDEKSKEEQKKERERLRKKKLKQKKK